MIITVGIYVSSDNKKPFSLWHADLHDIRARAKIDIAVARLQLGNVGDSKSVGDGVHELRIDHGPGYRLYYGNDGRTLIIILCGGDKRSQKKDILRAKEYWRDYMTRKKLSRRESGHEKKNKR
jgi:putative addiction module killer protein